MKNIEKEPFGKTVIESRMKELNQEAIINKEIGEQMGISNQH